MRTIFCLFKNKWQWGKVGHSYNPSTSEEEKESGGVKVYQIHWEFRISLGYMRLCLKKIQNQSTNPSPHNFKFLYNS